MPASPPCLPTTTTASQHPTTHHSTESVEERSFSCPQSDDVMAFMNMAKEHFRRTAAPRSQAEQDQWNQVGAAVCLSVSRARGCGLLADATQHGTAWNDQVSLTTGHTQLSRLTTVYCCLSLSFLLSLRPSLPPTPVM